MAYATDSDLILRVTGAAALDPATRALALSDAMQRLDDTAYGNRAVEAHVYLAAHLLALWTGSLGGASAGPVTSLRAGDIAATFATPGGSADDLARTQWGRAFLEIDRRVVGYPLAVS